MCAYIQPRIEESEGKGVYVGVSDVPQVAHHSTTPREKIPSCPRQQLTSPPTKEKRERERESRVREPSYCV